MRNQKRGLAKIMKVKLKRRRKREEGGKVSENAGGKIRIKYKCIYSKNIVDHMTVDIVTITESSKRSLVKVNINEEINGCSKVIPEEVTPAKSLT